jgi:hypothetical protein
MICALSGAAHFFRAMPRPTAGGQNLRSPHAEYPFANCVGNSSTHTVHSSTDLVFPKQVGGATMDAFIASLAIALLLNSKALAQTPSAPTNTVVTISTANKFQQVLASSGTARRMLRISNNNTNRDSCWVFVGSGQASKEGSYEVPPGKEYVCYPPFVTSDAIQATCASSKDTLDVEYH